MRLIDLFLKNQRGSMVADVAKAGAAIGLLSLLAANLVATRTEQFDRDRLAKVAAAASGRNGDPMTTGSLRKAVSETKLDPCILPR
ncbi:hypothetical protein [Bosea sp. AAP35]|uniref:hypothetical protein n=1 Tax=Bosea sp. AAP35 TaxID=1523417 RepID=UPI0012E1CAC9|nr:hypothetical protein [Bosea sp. AAP35]